MKSDISLLVTQLSQITPCDSIFATTVTSNPNLWAVSFTTGRRLRWSAAVQKGGVALGA